MVISRVFFPRMLTAADYWWRFWLSYGHGMGNIVIESWINTYSTVIESADVTYLLSYRFSHKNNYAATGQMACYFFNYFNESYYAKVLVNRSKQIFLAFYPPENTKSLKFFPFRRNCFCLKRRKNNSSKNSGKFDLKLNMEKCCLCEMKRVMTHCI